MRTLDNDPQELRRFCLIGVKGIGKTTLIRSILADIPKVDYLIGSQVLRELVGPEFDQFDTFPEEEKQMYRELAISWMEERQKKTRKTILVDGHTTLFNPNVGRVEGVFTELDCKFFTDFILFEATPETILERRKNDPSKHRNLDIRLILEELAAERSESHKIAKRYGQKIQYLYEDGSNQQDLREKLVKILRGEEVGREKIK